MSSKYSPCGTEPLAASLLSAPRETTNYVLKNVPRELLEIGQDDFMWLCIVVDVNIQSKNVPPDIQYCMPLMELKTKLMLEYLVVVDHLALCIQQYFGPFSEHAGSNIGHLEPVIMSSFLVDLVGGLDLALIIRN